MPEPNVDLPARADALEQRVTRVEAMTEVVTAIRADVATIAEGVDSALAQHVAELESTVENHGRCWPGCSTTSKRPVVGTCRPSAYGSRGGSASR